MLLILLVLCSSLINHLLKMSQFDLQNWGVSADLVGGCSPGHGWGRLGLFPSHPPVKPGSQLRDTAAGL